MSRAADCRSHYGLCIVRDHPFGSLPPKILLVLLPVLALLAGCSDRPTAVVQAPPTSMPAVTPPPTRLPSATLPAPMPTPSPTATLPPTATATPAPSAATSLIAFDTYRDGNAEIYLLNVQAGGLTNLTRHPGADRAPAWRPDGQAIAFESDRDGNWELYALSLADGTVTRLTEHGAFDGAPTWSPDGTELAFESYRDGNLEVYVVSAGGGEARRLTHDPAGDYAPVWSPDGAWIAFTSWRDGNKEIYLVPAEGGEAVNLTQHPADDEDPAWAPDAAALAFVSWRDVDENTGNRNAEIYAISPLGGAVQRLTVNQWPDIDPAWDAEGQLVWAAYEPGPPFETYDPYRPGDYHLFRLSPAGPTQLLTGAWDDRRPAAAPPETTLPNQLAEVLGSPPAPRTPEASPEPGDLVDVVEVPSVVANYSGFPVRVNELVAPSLIAWQQEVLAATGWDYLGGTLGAWRNIDQVRKKPMYAYDYGYLSWHKAGRALDLALEYKVDGVNQMILTRDDLGQQVYWRIYLRAALQDGSQGEPLRENPWLHWWHIVPEQEPEAYDAGGKRLPVPSGYYVDFTAIAKRHGWERIACYSIEGDYHWNTDSNGTEYWHYERTDDLLWWEAMLQLYAEETLLEHAGWEAGLDKAQSPEMMRSKGIPTPAP